MPHHDTITDNVLELVTLLGGSRVGVSTIETLDGGPPSTDLTYVLDDATAAVTFAVPMDAGAITSYLAKEDRLWLEREMVQAYAVSDGIALQLANYLKARNFRAFPVASNNVFRPSDTDAGSNAVTYDPTATVYPDIAHRYLAVRSGVGHMGLSGNVLTPDHGAAVMLATVVTDAPLAPTDPLPDEENYCDDCRLCLAGCVARFMDFSKRERVTLGGHTIEYAARRNLARCDLVCSGYTGLAPGGKWSTWSPGRFPIPEDRDELAAAYPRITEAYAQWPKAQGGRRFYFTDHLLRTSCAHCQMLCAPERNERQRRFKLLKNSGVVIQREDGLLVAMTPDEAERELAGMAEERRGMYE